MITEAKRQCGTPARTLAALVLAVFTVSLGYGIVLPLLPYLVERYVATGPSVPELARNTGFLSGTYALALFLFAPAWGRLSDRRGRRGALLIGLVGFGASMISFSFIKSLAAVYAERFLSGMFAAAVTPVASAVVTDVAPTPERRARQLSLISIAGIAGFLLGPTFGVSVTRIAGSFSGVARPAGSLAMPLAVTALLAFLSALAAALTVRGANCDEEPKPAPTASVEGAARVVPRLLVLSFVVSAVIASFHVGLAVRGKQELAVTAYEIAMMFTECSVVMLLAQAAVFSPFVKPDATRWIIPPALVALAAGIFLVPRTSDSMSMFSVVGAVAVSAGVLSPILTYWISSNAGAARGAELGKQAAAASLGQTVGSAAGGLLFGGGTLSRVPFAVTGGLAFFGFLLSLALPQRLGRMRAGQSSSALQ